MECSDVFVQLVRSLSAKHPTKYEAAVSSSSERIIYALHSRGFAAHILRSSALKRFYLQVPKDLALEDWPEERIWSELRILTSDFKFAAYIDVPMVA